jgi:hypothetical protein
MPLLSLHLDDLLGGGPTLEVRVLPVVRAGKRSRHFRGSATVTALIDTGSTCTVLKESVAPELGLAAVSAATIHTASSANVICAEYDLELMVRPDMIFSVRALGLPMEGQSFGCLIGRDLLAQCALVYLGPQNQFVLSV